MSKPGKSLRNLCKKLKVRLTVKRNGKRVYKSVAVLKRQCANKKKRRTRKYGKTLLPKLRKISKKNVKHIYKLKDPHKKRILAIDEGIREEAKKTGRTMKKAAIAKKARFNVLRIYRKNRKLGECNKLTRDMRYIDKKYKLGKTKNICKKKRRRKFGTTLKNVKISGTKYGNVNYFLKLMEDELGNNWRNIVFDTNNILEGRKNDIKRLGQGRQGTVISIGPYAIKFTLKGTMCGDGINLIRHMYYDEELDSVQNFKLQKELGHFKDMNFGGYLNYIKKNFEENETTLKENWEDYVINYKNPYKKDCDVEILPFDGHIGNILYVKEMNVGFHIKTIKGKNYLYNIIDSASDFIHEMGGLLHQARIQMILSDYGIAPKVYAIYCGHDKDISFIAMERVKEILPLPISKRHSKQLINHLKILDRLGIIHNDHNLYNIMIDFNDNVKLIDFDRSFLLSQKNFPYKTNFAFAEHYNNYNVKKFINFWYELAKHKEFNLVKFNTMDYNLKKYPEVFQLYFKHLKKNIKT